MCAGWLASAPGGVWSQYPRSDAVLSVCPPHAALPVACMVAASGFAGVYVDANAVAPAAARVLSAVIDRAGGRFVDGDLIGGPVRPGGGTRLYLSGVAAGEVAALFAATDLEAVNLGDDVTAASALKMCYGAWTKGTSALLLTIRAAAAAYGVEEALVTEWARTQPDLAARTQAAAGTARKAWRFAGEMDQVASASPRSASPMASPAPPPSCTAGWLPARNCRTTRPFMRYCGWCAPRETRTPNRQIRRLVIGLRLGRVRKGP
jgi:hypothetical protein